MKIECPNLKLSEGLILSSNWPSTYLFPKFKLVYTYTMDKGCEGIVQLLSYILVEDNNFYYVFKKFDQESSEQK